MKLSNLILALPFVFLGCKRSSPAGVPVVPEAAAARAAPSKGPQLKVTVDGAPAAAWTQERLAAITQQAVVNSNGEKALGWSLRDVTRALAGGARVAALVDDEGTRVEVDAGQWRDASATPLLRTNHRGEFKAQWVKNGEAGEAILKHIQRVELAR
jgi:hypothetical protein